MGLNSDLVSISRAIRNQVLPELTHAIFTLDVEARAVVQIKRGSIEPAAWNQSGTPNGLLVAGK
jgi:hypothetical protein